MPAKKPIKIAFSPEEMTILEKFVHDNIMALKNGWKTLHEEKVVKWRNLYRGVPKQKDKSFPWKNASNVVIQLIGENCDILRARTLGTIWEVMPLWNASLVGEWSQQDRGGEQQEAIHEFMNLMGLEPTELDLYRVESQGFDEAFKFGTVVFKLPWITDMEVEAVGEMESKTVFSEFTKYDGPRPEKLQFEKWAATVSANTLEDADFKYHIVTLKKQQLEERKFRGAYQLDKDEWDRLLATPDRPGPDTAQQAAEENKGVRTEQGYENQEWDIYECWFPYFHQGRKHRMIYSYHLGTKKTLRSIYNFYPKNEEPWEMARFGYNDDGLLGYGLCEMLESYQEEVTTGHNQRVDNRTLANTSILRVDPNSKLDSIFAIYPNALVPANEGELEKIQLGANYPSSVEEERLTIELAKARAGTQDPGQQGAGGGTVNKKNSYSSMGTFSVMQAGNRRVNINITDMRYTHLKLGRKFLNQYAEFGIGQRGEYFGKRAELIKMALENIKKGKICLPIRAATASINKELEKQNDMLLTQVMQRHHMGISQILQAISSPQMPPEIKEFLVGWMDSSSLIMARILRNFGHDDVSRLLPERKLIEGASNGGKGSNGGAGSPTSGPTPESTGRAAVQQGNQASAIPGVEMASSTGGGSSNGVPH